MYTRKDFGRELKAKALMRQDVAEIGHWAYSMYLEHIEDIDDDFMDIIITLNTMEDGPEFAFTHEELNQIADDLIAGKDVNI